MKRVNYLFIMIITAGIALGSCNTAQKPEADSGKKSEKIDADKLTVDLNKSVVAWKGEMLSRYSHTGIINLIEANLTVTGGKIAGGSFTVDMHTITPTDELYNPEEGRSKERLVGHLSSPDFFDVENYPVSTFNIKHVDGSTVTGDFTVRGITHEEQVENVSVTREDDSYKISGELTFDRTKYDVRFQMTLQDMVLSNDIKLNIELLAS